MNDERFAVRRFAIIVAFLIAVSVCVFSQASATEVTLAGTISCAKCGPLEPLHKGYTRWTWALHSVGEGDEIVLVVKNQSYKLQGDRHKLLQYMESRVVITGALEGARVNVWTISPVGKDK